MKNISISMMFAFFIAILIAFDTDGWMIIILASAALHEIGHVVAIALWGGKIERFEASMAGCKITYTSRKQTSYATDAILALAGPAFNLLSVLLAVPLPNKSEAVFYFIGTNIILAFLNLLPAMPLDGGRAMYALLAQKTDTARAERISQEVSAVILLLLAAASIGVLILSRFNAAIMMAGMAILFALCDKTALQKSHIPL